jgi:hypothetical protein
MTAGAASSGLVAVLFDGRSPLSMTAVMAVCSLLALITYWLLAHRAERRRLHSQTAAVPAATERAIRSWSSAIPQQKPTK